MSISDDTDEKIKTLQLRLTAAEFQISKLTQLFETIVGTMQQQNDLSQMQCSKCYITIESKQPGTCTEQDCPCGLN